MTLISRGTSLVVFAVLLVGGPLTAFSQGAEPVSRVGSASEPIRYVGHAQPNLEFPDGSLPPVVGVQNIQVMRANRTHPKAEGSDGLGWTYNHAPMLCYWRGKFYLEYLSDPVGEHIPPGHTLLTASKDGYHWSTPRVIFPSFKASEEKGMTVSHQRMGFFVAPDGRLLVLAFYGCAPRPNNGTGMGRVVRELHEDGTLGPIYFIRYNRHVGWNESNTPYPFYKASDDEGFVAACDALLRNKLMTQQWWEEDRAEDGFFAIAGRESGFDAKALSFFHRKDGAVVGLWKKRWTALSFDDGQSWTDPVRPPTLITGGAKIWGQRTDDGRYALAFDPDTGIRYPLVTITSDDGITFSNMLVVHGEVPYPRYDGQYKSMGPQYVRGIEEGNGNPPGNDMWLTYSVNKEDIWLSRVPVPIRGTVDHPIHDDFNDQQIGPRIRDWNVYSPAWAPVALVRDPGDEAGVCLQLRDEDRYDYARAVRVFPAASKVELRFRLRAEALSAAGLEIEVLDRHGHRPVRLRLDENAALSAWNGKRLGKLAPLHRRHWHTLELDVNVPRKQFSVTLDGNALLNQAAFAEASGPTVERLSFRTGPIRDFDLRKADAQLDDHTLGDRLDGDIKVSPGIFLIDDVRSK